MNAQELERFYSYVGPQIAARAPLMLMCLLGVILTARYRKRARLQCFFAQIGFLLLLIAPVPEDLFRAYSLATYLRSRPPAHFRVWLEVIGELLGGDRITATFFCVRLGTSLAQALAVGLLIAAVVTGRHAEEAALLGPPGAEGVDDVSP